jgi:hypothetical protein
MKRLMLTLASALLVGWATPVQATPITYTVTTTGTGTLNGTPFTTALVTVTLTGDTSTVTAGSGALAGTLLSPGRATVTVVGVGTATFTHPTEAVVLPPSFKGMTVVVIASEDEDMGVLTGTVTGILGLGNNALGSYGLTSPLGPISGVAEWSPNGVYLTTSGGFQLTSVAGTSTFTATLATRIVPGDFDGDGKSDITVYRPSNGGWYTLLSSTGYTTYVNYQWGLTGDITVLGDFDGDGKADIAVYRPSNGGWYILLSSTNFTTYVSYLWGLTGDVPVAADYDGDGKTDIAVYRPSNGEWYILWSSTNYSTYDAYQWGLPGDVPLLKRS